MSHKPKLTWTLCLVPAALVVAGLFWREVSLDFSFTFWWLLSITLVTGLAFWYDKWRAVRNANKAESSRGAGRVPEFTLLMLIAIGGIIGAAIVMLMTRHKMRDRPFLASLLLILIAQCVVFGFSFPWSSNF